jgi:hypothetical protein
MKHWDLTPKQQVTLIRQDGHKLPAQFLFRDTVRACFQVLDQEQCGEFVQFQLMDDGTLKDSPTREQLLKAGHRLHPKCSDEFGSRRSFESVLKGCKRWKIEPCQA